MEFRELGRKAWPESDTFNAKEYVQACLDLSNWKEGDDVGLANDYVQQLITREAAARDIQIQMLLTTPGAVWTPFSVAVDGRQIEKTVLAVRNRLRTRLDQLLNWKSPTQRRALLASAAAAVEAVRVETATALELDLSSGRLVRTRKERYFPNGEDGYEGLLLAFLLDPDQPLGELKACKFCGAYFLSVANINGGPKPRYCPGTDHQIRADALASRKRSEKRRRLRAKAAQAAYKRR
jgi:hypothetical protein